MATRIETGVKPELVDPRARAVARELHEFLKLPVGGCRTLDVYTLDLPLSTEEIEAAAAEIFRDPVTAVAAVGGGLARTLMPDFAWALEVGYLPGVTDNEGRTAKEAVEMLTGRDYEHAALVYTSIQYLFDASLTRADVDRAASGLIANPLIQRWTIMSRDEYEKAGGFPAVTPKVTGNAKPQVEAVDLELSDEKLMELSKERLLALALYELHALRDHYRKPETQAARKAAGLPPDRPTDVELECLAQTWSEHCKHKIFNAVIEYEEGGKSEVVDSIFKKYIVGATSAVKEARGDDDICLSVFKDNAGVIKFLDDWSLCFKVETHNSPSALDPYGGALTGIVGVNRDPMGTGMGARLVFNVDTFCFADPFYAGDLPPRLMHPRRIYEGVVKGVEHGGNKSGIPTVNGTVVFDDRFLGKPMVFCGTAGLIPAKLDGIDGHVKRAKPGDLIVMAGGRIGKDGIHGATFSSEELHEGSPATAVQLGDPITQKRLYDFMLIARDKGLFSSITDNGAGGLSSSVGEMSEATGGAKLHLDRAPLKYEGLHPWEILVSESQERMTIAVRPEMIDEFLALAAKMKVEAVVMGEFTDDGVFEALYAGKTVALLPLEFLHDGLPRMQLKARWEKPVRSEPDAQCPADLTPALASLMGRLNICSKESIVRRYDHEVQGGSVVKPFVGAFNDGPSDAAVVRPVLESFAGVVTANGICPRLSDVDAFDMAACALDEAVRNAVAVGASLEHLAGLDNFCWCDPVESEKTPDGRYKLAQLVRSCRAIYDLCLAYGVPLISGKDSMKNDYHIGGTKISIPPTLLFSVIGKIDDARLAVTMDAKAEGDLVYVCGKTRAEMGGSEYWASLGYIGNTAPKVIAAETLPRYRALEKAIKEGLVASCHDASDGGLAVALAETAFAGALGIVADLSKAPVEGVARDDELLFSESAGRFVITVKPENSARFEEVMAGTDTEWVGQVTDEQKLSIRGLAGAEVVNAETAALKAAWQKTLASI